MAVENPFQRQARLLPDELGPGGGGRAASRQPGLGLTSAAILAKLFGLGMGVSPWFRNEVLEVLNAGGEGLARLFSRN